VRPPPFASESPRVAVLGLGRAGSALAAEFATAGVSIAGLWNRSRVSLPPFDRLPALALGDGSDPGERVTSWGADVVVVAIRDDALPTFIRGLRIPRGTVVLHTSGSLPLASLQGADGIHIGGWHPLQSFGSSRDRASEPYWVALDGDDRAVAAGRALAEATGHDAVVVRGAAKAAYHAAAVLASNALVALEATAARVMASAGVPPEACWPLLRPLVMGTLNNLAGGDFSAAMTGPVARGDARTVVRNLQALKEVPGAAEVYRVLAHEGLRVVSETLDERDAERVRGALRGPEPAV
jgi:predicted short-subunit dehydrogenase-like oxidoreductase (DUF2520 family)